jgi:hypothetical protein
MPKSSNMRASTTFGKRQSYVPNESKKLMNDLRKTHFTFGQDYDTKVNPKTNKNNDQKLPFDSLEPHFIAR